MARKTKLNQEREKFQPIICCRSCRFTFSLMQHYWTHRCVRWTARALNMTKGVW